MLKQVFYARVLFWVFCVSFFLSLVTLLRLAQRSANCNNYCAIELPTPLERIAFEELCSPLWRSSEWSVKDKGDSQRGRGREIPRAEIKVRSQQPAGLRTVMRGLVNSFGGLQGGHQMCNLISVYLGSYT